MLPVRRVIHADDGGGRPGRTLTRREFYDLAWSKPLDALALDLGISDRGLSKLCARHFIPLPPQGYWLLKVKPARPALPTLRRTKERIFIERHPVVPRQHKLIRESQKAPLADPPGYIAAAKAHRWIRASVSELRNHWPDPHNAVAVGEGLCGVRCRKVDTYRAVRLLDGLARAVEARGLMLRPAGDRMKVALGDDSIDVELAGADDGYFVLRILGRNNRWKDTTEILLERLVPRIVIEFEVVLRDEAARRVAREAFLLESQERDLRRAAEREQQWRLAGVWSHLDRLAEQSGSLAEVQAWLDASRGSLPRAVVDVLDAGISYAKARRAAAIPP